MSFLVYFFVLLVAASSVLFGLDWMQAPLQPPAPAPRIVQAAVPPVQPAATPADSPATLTTATVGQAAPAPISVEGNTPAPTDAIKADASEAKPAPLCDIAACERAYHTFTPADCTYKPSFTGPRRLCTKGNPPHKPSAQLASTEANARAACNVAACESAYQSFDAATCTYQPTWGPRRLCTK
jgi:hypothetical protein